MGVKLHSGSAVAAFATAEPGSSFFGTAQPMPADRRGGLSCPIRAAVDRGGFSPAETESRFSVQRKNAPLGPTADHSRLGAKLAKWRWEGMGSGAQ